jgi:hypothetical protein
MLLGFLKAKKKNPAFEGAFPSILSAPDALTRNLDERARTYQNNAPFPHIARDGLFDADTLQGVIADIPSPLTRSDLFSKDIAHLQENKFAWRDVSRMGEQSLRFINMLQSKPFLEFLTTLTGVQGLVSDPYLWGGGYHQILRGGKLAIHADFNIHPQTQLYRRLNVLVYLNKNWQEAWGGCVELWSEDMKQCAHKIAPLFNRMVVFNTTEKSFHGHPDALNCPPNVIRRSLALYYYTYERPINHAHSTLWQARPQDAPDINDAISQETIVNP